MWKVAPFEISAKSQMGKKMAILQGKSLLSHTKKIPKNVPIFGISIKLGSPLAQRGTLIPSTAPQGYRLKGTQPLSATQAVMNAHI